MDKKQIKIFMKINKETLLNLKNDRYRINYIYNRLNLKKNVISYRSVKNYYNDIIDNLKRQLEINKYITI